MSCGVGHRLGSDPTFLRLWCALSAAAPIWPLAWEPPHALGATLKSEKKKKVMTTSISYDRARYSVTKRYQIKCLKNKLIFLSYDNL